MTTVLADGNAPAAGAGTDLLWSFAGRPGGLIAGPGGSVLASDTTSRTIWQVSADGAAVPAVGGEGDTETTAGDGVGEGVGGEVQTGFRAPSGLALAPDGTLYVADTTADRVCTVAPDGTVSTIAGGANGYQDGRGGDARFRRPLDVALAPDGSVFVADTGNDRVRRIAPDGSVTTVAGSLYDYGDGTGAEARFRRPAALDVDAAGTCFVVDAGNNALRRIAPDGVVTTVAGAPPGGDADGSGPGVGLRGPTGLALGPDGAVWLADHGNGAVRQISADGTSHTVVRLGGGLRPTALALRSDGALVVATLSLADGRVPWTTLVIVATGGGAGSS